ncbi:MAG: 16S rRNA (cytidine(1402)-2'-O)-methyltransferase [Deltaproteobacteria bacterium]|nr:16S rRNA (cytidine(1402)-2'-O)-methyltransferase [Deltaproteobacteria bacterium]
MAKDPGTLYLVATPIGNLEDLSHRAVRILGEVDLIAAEDTRAAQVLLRRYSLRRPLLSYFEGNEAERAAALLGRLQGGARVALIAQAGTPGISDPGYRLTELCRRAGVRIEVLPGASAVLTALVAAGLPTDRFLFLGFPPRTAEKRRLAFARVRTLDATLVIYEAPGRVPDTLVDLLTVLGEREAAVCRELTKVHEEVVRGKLSELAAMYGRTPARGEVTLVVDGAPRGQSLDESIDVGAEVRREVAAGRSPREIAAELSLRTGKPRRLIYQLAVSVRREPPSR